MQPSAGLGKRQHVSNSDGDALRAQLASLFENIRAVIVGKDDIVRLTITSLLARGHVLIEDVPGLGKTMLARSLAQSLEASFRRIQFTPDLLPSDVTGVSVYRSGAGEFEFLAGPVFTEVLLADEINRTSPRTQSALLEAMEERQVTIDGETRPLPSCFFVLATQNPIELEGTYPLPEAQIDRFLMRLELGYPTPREEVSILAAQVREHPIDSLESVIGVEDLVRMQGEVTEVLVSHEMQTYIVAITASTRKLADVRVGVSPRGSLALMRAAQAWSYLHGVEYVSPDAIKAVAPWVLAHRLVVDAHRESAGLSRRDIILKLLDKVPVPTLPAQDAGGGTRELAHGQDPAERTE